MIQGNTESHPMLSEHNNHTQTTADNIAAEPSGREINSIECRKRKKLTTTTTTQNGQLRSFDALPHLHIHKVQGTMRAEYREDRKGHTQRRTGAPPTLTPQGIHGQHSPGLHWVKQGIQGNDRWRFKRPSPATRKQINYQSTIPHQERKGNADQDADEAELTSKEIWISPGHCHDTTHGV
jgi:hypothetical protein